MKLLKKTEDRRTHSRKTSVVQWVERHVREEETFDELNIAATLICAAGSKTIRESSRIWPEAT